MDTATIFQSLNKQFPDQVREAQPEVGDPWIEVDAGRLVDVCRHLRDEPALAMNMLHCVSGVDYYTTIPKKGAKSDWEPHVEVVYQLSSLKHKHGVTLKVILPRWKDDQPGSLPEVDSVSGIWSTADWHEREVFDLVGVRFLGHPDLRRILCPEDWAGHPLRKDYEMPTEYHGIRAR